MKLNYTSLQHPVDPVERPRAMTRCERPPDAARRCRSWSCPCTATWRRPPGRRRRRRRGCRSATCRPGAGRCRARSRRDVAELRERGLLCGHVTAAPAYGGEHEAISARRRARRRRRRLGWDAVIVGPGPGIIGSETRARPRRHGRARQRPRGAGAGPADAALAAPLRGRPARAPPRPQPPHPARCSSCCSARSRSPVPGGRGGARPPRLAEAPRLSATGCAPRAGRPGRLRGQRACRRGRWAAASTRTRSSSPPRWPPAARRSPGARLAPQGMRPRPGEPPGMAIAVKPPQRARRRGGPAAERALRGPRPRLPLLPGAGARPLAQHAQRLPHRPAPVRRIPRRARARRARRSRPADIADFLAELATGNGRPALLGRRRSTARPPACAPSTSTCAATS